MHLKTRQRLIGLLLLLLLAAILTPLVLRSPDQVRVALDMSIPEPPQIDEPRVAPVISEDEQAATDRQIDEERQAVADAGERQLAQPPAAAEPDAAEPENADPGNAVSEKSRVEPANDPAPAAEGNPAERGENGPAPGFTVQVASFSDAANANALVARLREAGYSAYHRTVSQDNNTWERVFVGPEIKREDAETLRQRLADDKTFALDGLVRAFVP